MKTFKRTMLRVFFALEVVIFIGVYLFGPRGIQAMSILESEGQAISQKIVVLNDLIDEKKEEIALWKSDDFYKEKIAREKLQMARSSDQVFYVKGQS